MREDRVIDISFSFPAMMVLGASVLVAVAAASAAEVSPSTIDSGGVTSAGGGFEVTGSIGQPDAGEMSGGSFALSGGFWSSTHPFVPVELQSFEVVGGAPPDQTPTAALASTTEPAVLVNRPEETAAVTAALPIEPKEDPADDPEPTRRAPN